MIPVIAVVGWHNAGKTRFVEGLVKALKARGLRVATIKHSGHFQLDREGTDTWRYAQAGSDLILISGGGQVALLERVDQDLPLSALLARLPAGLDLVIAEGFKRADVPKFEIVRRETGLERIAPDGQLLALVTPEKSLCDGDLPCLHCDDYQGALALLAAQGLFPKAPTQGEA